MDNITIVQAQMAQSMLENCVIQLLIEYYKEYGKTTGGTPKQIGATLGIFRGTGYVGGGMRMNDAIITGILQNLIIRGQVEKIEGAKPRGQYRLTHIEASKYGL